MILLRLLLLPITLPSWIGCKASDGFAASIDALVGAVATAATRLRSTLRRDARKRP